MKWYHRVPCTESRQRIGISTLEEIILRRQLRWAGRIVRMSLDCLPRQVRCGELEAGMRSVRGQRERYKDNLKRTMKQFNIDPTSLDLARGHRIKWKHLVSTAASVFASAYDVADTVRHARHCNPPNDGADQVP